MLSNTLPLVASLAVAASAYYLDTPENSASGLVHTSITCNAVDTDLVGLTLDSFSTALGPSIIEQGQQFRINDVAANLTIPALISTALGLAVDHINTNVHIYLDITGATPNPLNTVPAGVWINGTRPNLLGDTLLQAPMGGGVVNGLGPITITGQPGTTAQVYVQLATAQLYLYGVAGNLLRSVTLYCARPPYAVLFAQYNIVAPTTPTPAPYDNRRGYLLDYPDVDRQYQFTCHGVPYTGTIGSSQYTFATTSCGTSKAYVEESDIASYEDSTTRISISQAQIASFQQQYPGATGVDVTINSFILNATNASPSGLEGAPIPAETLSYNFPSSGNLTVEIGENALNRGYNWGPFTAAGSAANRDTLSFSPGALTATFNFRNAAGTSVGSTRSTLVSAFNGFLASGRGIVPAGATQNPLLTGF